MQSENQINAKGKKFVDAAEHSNGSGYDIWKETVRMNSIQVPRHAHFWILNSASESVLT